MKKIFLVLFSLIFMCSVSFGVETGVVYTSFSKKSGSSSTLSDDFKIGGYTETEVVNILKNMTKNPTNDAYILLYDTLINNIKSEDLEFVTYIYVHNGTREYWIAVENPDVDIDLDFFVNGKTFGILNHDNTSVEKGALLFSGRSAVSYVSSYANFSNNTSYCDLMIGEFLSANVDIYQMTSSSGGFTWDGESYFYKHTSSGEDTEENETNLTDEQIAEIVTRFVNSDAYLINNKNEYNNFFITYNKLTKYYRAYTYHENMDLAISYGNYNEDGEFVTTGTKEGEAWQIRPYVFDGNIFRKLYDWLSSKYNNVSFTYYSISSDSTINPRYVGDLEYSYCSDYRENEFVVYSTKQIRFLGEEINSEGETETIVIDDYIPKTVLINSETGEEIIIENNMQDSSDSLENIITPNADFSGLKETFEKYISFVNISSITWLTTAISSMITIFVPFVALGIIIFLINRILNGGS